MTINIRRNTLANDIANSLTANSGRYEEAAITTGRTAETYEDYLIRAFSYSTDNQADIKKLAEEMGVKDRFIDEKGNFSEHALQGLQTIAKTRYERSSRAMSMLVQLLSNLHQNTMNIIQSIRTR